MSADKRPSTGLSSPARHDLRARGRDGVYGGAFASLLMAARTLLYDRLRLAISLGALAFAVVLVLLLRGIMDGTVAKSTTYVDHVGASVFVAPAGVRTMALTATSMPESAVAQVAGIPGVRNAAGIIRFQVIVSAPPSNRQPAAAVLIGYDPQISLGGPWKLHSGDSVRADDEVVLDRTLADSLGAKLGTLISIAGHDFRVVGVSDQTTAIAGKLAFISLSAAQQLFRLTGTVSYILLQTSPGSEGTVITAISQNLPQLSALTQRELSASDRELLSGLFVQTINVMSTIGLLVGLAIVGLTMYILTSERLRDFGVLKAIGAPANFLLRTVLVQSLALGVAGFALGLVATQIVGPIIVNFVPEIGIQVETEPAVTTLAAVAMMAAVGALLPVVRIVRVDPLIVFRRA